VQEARERVRVAISNSGYKFPTKKVIVNLAPDSIPISYPTNGVKPP
jgi:magnesium chelatase family protein